MGISPTLRCGSPQKHANNQGDSNHDDRDARDAIERFRDRGPELIEQPYQEAAEESDQDDVDDEIYECVHGDLGSLRIVFRGGAVREPSEFEAAFDTSLGNE